MKTLIYSPINNLNDNEFFESMEFASQFGADLIIFAEGVKTPYTELLSGMDVLNGEDYNYVLESLYGFCFELEGAAVFNGTDGYGMHFSIFVNPFAEKGETFNKLYIKHATADGSVFELEDYKDCTSEIFQPVLYKGTKIGMVMGDDIYLPKLFSRYQKSGVNTVFACAVSHSESYINAAADVSEAFNMAIVSAGTGGTVLSQTPLGQKQTDSISPCLYITEHDKTDFAKKCSLLKNDLSDKYVPRDKMELYKLL